MPQYHFHVSDDGRPDFDTRDMEFPDAAAAGADALRYAGGVLRDRAGQSELDGAWQVEVVDEAGLTLLQAKFLVQVFPSGHSRCSGCNRR